MHIFCSRSSTFADFGWDWYLCLVYWNFTENINLIKSQQKSTHPNKKICICQKFTLTLNKWYVYDTQCPNVYFKLRWDIKKKFIWSLHLCVGRRRDGNLS